LGMMNAPSRSWSARKARPFSSCVTMPRLRLINKVYAESFGLIPLQNQKLALKVVIATVLRKLFPKPEPFA